MEKYIKPEYGMIEKRQWIGRPIHDVFEFFANAYNLEKITPDFLRFRVVSMSTAAIRRGTLINYRLKIHGIPVSWTSRIEEWRPPFFFSDFQVKGPYQFWLHQHEFVEENGGTAIIDRVRYKIPFSAIVPTFVSDWVSRDVDAIFAHREKVIAELFR